LAVLWFKLRTTPPALFCDGIFQDRVSLAIHLGLAPEPGLFSFFAYIKYIGKSTVAFCYHDCYVGRRKEGKANAFLEEKKKGERKERRPSPQKPTDQKKNNEKLRN
jgi:hypothetical protein